MELLLSRVSITAGVALLLSGCGGSRPPPADLSPDPGPSQRSLARREFIYVHVEPTVATGDSVNAGTTLGFVQEMPAVQSAANQHLLAAARQLYDQERFEEAASVVQPAFITEPDNPFILNEYARALFRVDSLKPQSRRVYVELVELLTAGQSHAPNTLVVDLWFIDAYWKLAMLYLDVEEYARALNELLKVKVAGSSDPTFDEQVYAYFAEAYYFLGDQTAAEEFVRKTLELNPDNEYVLQFRVSR